MNKIYSDLEWVKPNYDENTNTDLEMVNVNEEYIQNKSEEYTETYIDESIIESAVQWNETTEIVSSNSGNWNTSYTTYNNLSAYITTAISSLSSEITNINTNTQKIDELSSKYENTHIWFDETITGKGTELETYGVKNYNKIIDKISNLEEGYKKLYKDGNPNWISRDDKKDTGTNPYLTGCFETIRKEQAIQDTRLHHHDDLIKYIIQTRSNVYKTIPGTVSKEDIPKLSGDGIIYCINI